MTVRDDRREAAIEHMADHVLDVGLAAASLRSLAAAAGTSDRMLLYYFADKDELLAATLERVAARLTARLDAALPAGTRLPREVLLQTLWMGMSDPGLKAYLLIWLELAAGAARGQEPHRTVGGAIADGFLAWIAERLEGSARGQAAQLLATIDGLLLLDALGRRDMALEAVAAGSEGA